MTKVITVRGRRKENLVPDWIAAEAMQIIDPHRQAPPLVREAALVLLRDLARETMRAYRPPPNALRLIEEAAEAEADDIVRRAAEEAEAHRLRCVPLICGLCGKKAADERRSLILQYAPPVRICETCIVTLVVTELQRHWAAEAAARAAKALEAACVRDSRRRASPEARTRSALRSAGPEGRAMIDRIAKLWAQGKSMSAIAESLGVSRGKCRRRDQPRSERRRFAIPNAYEGRASLRLKRPCSRPRSQRPAARRPHRRAGQLGRPAGDGAATRPRDEGRHRSGDRVAARWS